MHDIAGALPAVAFWMFIAAIVVASIAGKAFRHQETQKTIRKAIESGQSLDPQTLDRLLESTRPKGPPPRAGFLVGGIMMLAIGAGLALIGLLTGQTDHDALYQGLGAGGLVGIIGVGLLVAGVTVGHSGNGQG